MDHPIFSPIIVGPEEKVDDNYVTCLLRSICDDDKDEFLRLIKDPMFQSDSWPLSFIFQLDPLKCVTAILDGETKGIIDMEDTFPPGTGYTPLHLAAARSAPRLTNLFIQKALGDVDVPTLQHRLTPLDYSLRSCARCYEPEKPPSLFQMLLKILVHKRGTLEVMRMLIHKSEDKACVTKAFMDYAHKGQLLQVTMLFLAAPELFSYALVKLQSEKGTDIEEQLSLLLDVLMTVGDMLVAYIRLEETSDQSFHKTELAIDLFLHEATRKKLGVASPGYYMRFHKTPGADQQHYDDQDCSDGWQFDAESMFACMAIFETWKDFNQFYIYSLLPSLKPKDADRLQRAIKKKLSSMPPLVGFLKPKLQTLKKVEKPLPKRFYFSLGRSSVPMRAFCTSVASARIKFDFNSSPAISLGNKMMKPSPTLAPAMAMSIFSGMKLAHFPVIAKRLIK